MSNNRRSFIKNISMTAAAGITLPQILMSATGAVNRQPVNEGLKTILFQGDSITDGGRSYDQDWNHVYGQDYDYMITARLNYEYPERDYKFFNGGISGNTAVDLLQRWKKDTIDLKPDLLSVLIGINDVFAVIIKGEKNTVDNFRDICDQLFAQTKEALPETKLVICEPFILPVGIVKDNLTLWTAELKKRQLVLKELAIKYSALFVPLQSAFNKAVLKAPATHWIWDGIHPMPAGHELIARKWLKNVRKHFHIF